VRWWLLACLFALAACGDNAVATSDVLFQYDVGNHLHQYGGRVFSDGRYELYAGTAHWERFDPFTPEQVAEIKAAVEQAQDLPAEIKDGTPPPDAAKATFNLDGHRVVVDNYPKASPPAIERILERIAELRKRPPTPTVWHLWSHGQVVRLEARCDIGEVKVLRRLRDAIFMEDARADHPRTKDPPAKTPLVSIDFAGKEKLEVFADGRRVDHRGTHRLGDGQLDAIRAALAATDWGKLPPRLC
jgi:hypothetical protein